MRRFKTFILTLVIVLGGISASYAFPHMWTDTHDRTNAPIYFGGPNNSTPGVVQAYDFVHDIRDEGFTPPGFVFTDPQIHDWVENYTLSLTLYDDANNNVDEHDLVNNRGRVADEGVNILIAGIPSGRQEVNYTNANFGWNLSGIVELNVLGQLGVNLVRTDGDFFFSKSVLKARGNDADAAPVPEPATMLLMGTGLAGTAAICRRKSREKLP